ncbi:dihydrodipicolinate synthase family protein [Photobacterium sp. DNB23_23_1]
MKLSFQVKGVCVIAVTPFTSEGDIDYESIDSMTDYYLDTGVDAITLLGMMGEAPKLTMEEAISVVERVCKRVKGRVPIIVGVSSPGIASLVELAKKVVQIGAKAVMVAPLSSLKTDSQVFDYYALVSKSLGQIPFVLQDFPLATGVQISAPLLARIVNELDNCVMVKHEDWPGLEKISYLRAHCEDVYILCGNGGLFIPEELGRGADGAMTGFAYSEMMVDVCKAFKEGDRNRAHDLFDAYLPLARYEQQPGLGLAIRKWIMYSRGIIASPSLRAPGPVLSSQAKDEISYLIDRQNNQLRGLL